MKNMWLGALLLAVTVPLFAETFAFKYTEGDSYTVESTSMYDVFVNEKYNSTVQNAETARYVVGQTADGKTVHEVSVKTSAGAKQKNAPKEEKFTFSRDKAGVFTIDAKMLLPTVRNVPVFPKTEVNIGDKWTFIGEEIQNLSTLLAAEPLRIPITVHYTYLDTETKNGETLHKILVQYQFQYTNPSRPATRIKNYLLNLAGFSEKIIYWNNDIGLVESQTEQFSLIMRTLDNVTIELAGTSTAFLKDVTPYDPKIVEPLLTDDEVPIENAEAEDAIIIQETPEDDELIDEEVVEIELEEALPAEEPMIENAEAEDAVIIQETPEDDELIAEEVVEIELEEALPAEELENTETENIAEEIAETAEDASAVFFESIYFNPDSSVLLDTEKEKLRVIAEVIVLYDERSLLITGYTALAGSAEGRQRLSLERANTVAEFLVNLQAAKTENILCVGAGAENSATSGTTEAERSKHRRVEIHFEH